MTIPGLSHDASLLLFALIAVVGLVVLIARFKVNSFVALILASLFVGLTSGMDLAEIGSGFQNGVGKILASIAMIVGLGTLLGKLLAELPGGRGSQARRWRQRHRRPQCGDGVAGKLIRCPYC